ncbi:LysR family transcriptional regulator [Pseudonocardia sp. ICBG601]|uniref:LysR family transcriptional regulator n=1 Tax=Pseudonocardia sp. ICBG601 TaxID=2846759 RepID=UPI001CF6EEAF|nr:LysR family transcriptional regulator [Pseudonocardia sp. ICBG601]
MSGPSLQRLRVFVTIVDAGGVTAAARTLGLAQSSVSAHLRQLEAELGTRLLARDTGRLRTTPAGDTMLEHARRLLDLYAEAVAGVQELGHGPVGGTLAIGGTATAGEGVLPRLLTEYTRLHPLVDVDLRIDNTTETLRRLDAGDIGIAVTADDGVGPGHESVVVASETQIVVAAADHPLAGGTADPAALRGSTVLVRERGSTTRAYQLDLLERWGIPGTRVWTVGGTAAIVHAVAAGLGIACVPRGAADDALRLGRIAELGLAPAPATRPVHLVLRTGRVLTRPESEFVTLARERTTP